MDDETTCPICLEEYSRDEWILSDGNMNHNIDSNCKHWFCIHCLRKMFEHRIFNCPICRENIIILVSTYYHPRFCFTPEESLENESYEEEEDFEEEDDYENQIERQSPITIEYNDEISDASSN